jgi:soluble lytic murein transglycosylase-like protein
MRRITTAAGSLFAAIATALALPAQASAVPSEYLPWLRSSAAQCTGISPALLAAQIFVESGFRANAVSSSNAQGPSQFIPSTWAVWGVDGDKDGDRDPFSIPDAVMAQGAFMCDNLSRFTAGVNSGQLRGDPLDLALAGYNAGPGAVLRAGGMPSGDARANRVREYVAKIRALEPTYAWIGGGTDPNVPDPGTPEPETPGTETPGPGTPNTPLPELDLDLLMSLTGSLGY